MAKCLRCNRALKDKQSIDRGYGPICWAKVQAASEAGQENEQDGHIAEPLDEFIILERTKDGIRTNVPHLVTHHSPTGFEWGYEGSGPADLALNILEAVLRLLEYKGETTNDTWRKQRCFRWAYQLHQSFKREFVAQIPREGGKVYTNDVISWLNAQKVLVD